ncbi:hypothetical protein ACX2JU_004147 [Klebsiella variicola]|uniref:hypothetical protein n=1 Tax=unclassified Klebsiella TaxID=2608929 RepID=UPI0032B5FB9E|nr:hypothetical protein [Klebsiella variicola]
MKRLIIALALLSPLAVQANEWNVICGGVKLDIIQTANTGSYIKKDGKPYVMAGGVTSGNLDTDVYAHLVRTEGEMVLADVTQSFEMEQSGVDDKTVFHLVDTRGNHKCSVNSFKAGE